MPDNKDEEVTVKAEDAFKASPNDEYIVVCVDCLNQLNSESVMRSFWYASGQLPPCGCGGKTVEIPLNSYKEFREQALSGKRFL